MTHHPTITDALELAEGIPENSGNWHVLRPLLIALRTLAKDQEMAAASFLNRKRK